MYYPLSSIIIHLSSEKEIKGWRREKKNNLIEGLNPSWSDLSQH
jgi:putative endonuclease